MILGNIQDVEEKEVKTTQFKGKSLPVEGTTVKWLSQAVEAVSPEYGLRFFTIKPGGYISVHQHKYVQTVIMMSGRLMTTLYNDNEEIIEEREVGPSDYCYVAPMEIHAMRNDSTENATFFCCICVLAD